MTKMSKNSESTQVSTTETGEVLLNRRNFFKKAAVYSASAVAASSLLSPVKLLAEGKDDEFIMEEQPWATSLGYELNKNPYGVPSPYEHNVVRRTTPLLSSAGDMHAAISVTPLQDLKGIITPWSSKNRLQ